jgi:hypothetical protein
MLENSTAVVAPKLPPSAPRDAHRKRQHGRSRATNNPRFLLKWPLTPRAVRLVIDSEQASVLDGGSADLGKLNVAVQSLIALLPNRELPKPERDAPSRADPRAAMWRVYSEMRARGAAGFEGYDGKVKQVEALQARVAELERELSQLKGEAPGQESPPAALPGNVRTLSPKGAPAASTELAQPKPRPSPSVVVVEPRDEPWRAYVEPDGSIRSTPRGPWSI